MKEKRHPNVEEQIYTVGSNLTWSSPCTRIIKLARGSIQKGKQLVTLWQERKTDRYKYYSDKFSGERKRRPPLCVHCTRETLFSTFTGRQRSRFISGRSIYNLGNCSCTRNFVYNASLLLQSLALLWICNIPRYTLKIHELGWVKANGNLQRSFTSFVYIRYFERNAP